MRRFLGVEKGVIGITPPACPCPDRLTADERARLFPVGRTGLVQYQYRGDTARSPRPRARLVPWRAALRTEVRELHRRDHHWSWCPADPVGKASLSRWPAASGPVAPR